jgi:hypothetical protein
VSVDVTEAERCTRDARDSDRQVRRAAETANCGRFAADSRTLGAPFRCRGVAPAKVWVLSFGSATLEIPPGAVDRDVRVTIRPLPQDKLAPARAADDERDARRNCLPFRAARSGVQKGPSS